jgi:MFS transporter, DHA3 family, macrolide efflux protein
MDINRRAPEEDVAYAAPAEGEQANPQRSNGRLLLRSRDFGFLWAGQVISQIGDGLNKVALLWFVYDLTGSALKMTLVGLLQTIPPLLLGPLIGVYLDRLPKKPVMIWIDLLRTVLVLLIPVLYALDGLTLNRLYALVFMTAIVSTVFGPALVSAVPLIVGRKQLTAANALLQSSTNLGILIGPAISGFGIAFMGAQNVLYVNAGTFFLSALCLLPIRVRRLTLPRSATGGSPPIAHEMWEGFRFVFLQHQPMLALMVTAALYSLASSAFVFMLPVFAKQLLHMGPVELGWLWSALGIGMLCTSARLAWLDHGDVASRFRLISGAMVVGGAAVCSLSVVGGPVAAGVLMIIVGGSTALFTPVVWAVLQEMTPGHMLARVMTTFSTGGMFAAMLGMTAFGWAADALGAAISLFGIGLILMMTALMAARFSRRCETIEEAIMDPLPAA